MSETQRKLVNLAYEAMDHCAVLIAEGWASVTIRRGPVGDQGLAVVNISTKSGDLPYRKIPRGLGIDARKRTTWLSDSLDRIQESLREVGLIWDGLTVQIERLGPELTSPVDMRFVTVAGVPIANIVLESPDTDLVVTSDLLQIVAVEWESWRSRQREWNERYGSPSSWSFKHVDSRLEVASSDGTHAAFDAQVIGSHSGLHHTWCWSWANRSYEEKHFSRVAALRDDPDATDGLGLLRFPAFVCENGFAWSIAWLTATRIGPFPVFSPLIKKAELRVFFALIGELES